MRFDPGKAWPHPVLRPPSYGDDYPHAEFEVEIEVNRIKGSTAIEVVAEFQLSDPDLLRLVGEGAAHYVLLIKASQTHFRDLVKSDSPRITKAFAKGDLSGRTEFTPLLVCTRELSAFRAAGWHPDFAGRTYSIAVGAVLAEDVPKDYWIDTADEAPLGSIFGHRPSTNVPDGRWECQLDTDRIWIVMSNADATRYMAARDRTDRQPDGQYLMNGLYLPALITVLNEVDENADDYRDYRWFAYLDQRLDAVGCKPLGSKTSNRLIDAQMVLEKPFLRMPLMAEAGTDGV